MKRRIRDLDFDAILATIARATDPVRRTSCDSIIDADLTFVKAPDDSVALLRDHVLLAALHHAKTLDDVRIEHPLVQAVVRIQHHPLASPLPHVKVQEGLRGPDAGPRFTELAAAHPELSWDLDEVQALILEEIREVHGDHELDDAEPPWRMYWDPAAAAAYALKVLVTLRVFGDL